MRPANTSSTNLTGLSAGSTYSYTAYSDSACTDANKISTASSFTTLIGLAVSNIGETTATLTIAGHSSDWHYKANAAPHTACQSAVSTSSTDLTGLSANTTYTYEAYSASGCADTDKLATTAAFTTLPGLPRNVNVANSTLTGQNRRYPVSWQKPANTQASDTFAYQVQCTTVNDKTTTSWGACGTVNVASTAKHERVAAGESRLVVRHLQVRPRPYGEGRQVQRLGDWENPIRLLAPPAWPTRGGLPAAATGITPAGGRSTSRSGHVASPSPSGCNAGKRTPRPDQMTAGVMDGGRRVEYRGTGLQP